MFLKTLNLHKAPWEYPELTGVNTLPARSTLFPYDNTQEALGRDWQNCGNVRILNGDWKFKFLYSPTLIDEKYLSADYDDRSWDNISVPGCWTMQGYDQLRYNVNRVDFGINNPPHIPDNNPVGVYRTSFNAFRNAERTVLHFDGVESFFCVYLNGRQIGIGKDSRTATEFDLSEFVIPGRNQLTVVVLRYSDGSYLEDQDHWRMAGIFRDVYIYRTGKNYIADIFATALPDDNCRDGRIKLRLTGRFPDDDTDGWRFHVQLYDMDAMPVPHEDCHLEIPNQKKAYNWGQTCRHTLAINNIRTYSAETPYLYTLVVSLIAPTGKYVEVSSCRIGFRRIQIHDRQLLINGQPVMIHGMNRHEHNDRTGKTLSEAEMRQELELMRQFNVNAIRCAHYPATPQFYDLCDEYGFYVLDEANIESDFNRHNLSYDTRWTAAFLDRAISMVMRDKNHPSIIGWSLGNEAGWGENFGAIAGYIKEYDPDRFTFYADSCSVQKDRSNSQIMSDIICPMYSSIEDIIAWAETADDKRPLILSEYSHAEGNSNGSLMDYYEAFRTHHGLQGGFIWEWKDHGILQESSSGQPYWAYGGDFDDDPSGHCICIDGMTWPDLTPKPALYEFKKLAQPVHVSMVDKAQKTFEVFNRYHFTNLEVLDLYWELQVGGRTCTKGIIPHPCVAPQESLTINLQNELGELTTEGECFVNFYFKTNSEMPGIPLGHDVASEQIALRDSPNRKPVLHAPHAHNEKLHLEGTTDAYVVKGTDLELGLNRNTGAISYLHYSGRTIIQSGPELDVYRAATDNDGRKVCILRQSPTREPYPWERKPYWPLLAWLEYDLEALFQECYESKAYFCNERLIIQCSILGRLPKHPHAIRLEQTYTISPDATILVSNQLDVSKELPDLPRLGFKMRMPEAFEQLEWYGAGPHESYCDRMSSAPISHYANTVSSQYVPYIVPQEHGNHTQVREASLHDLQGGLLITAPGLMDFSASHYDARDLYSALHTCELSARPEVIVHLDCRNSGLGTGSCGPMTLEKYRVCPGQYVFDFALRPFLA